VVGPSVARAFTLTISRGELGERVRQVGRVEDDLDHALAGSHDPADPGREVVGQAMRFERVLDHG